MRLKTLTGRPAVSYVARAMLVETYYHGYRIEVNAELIEGRWDATVRLRRLFTEDKAIVQVVTCRKLSAELAERRAAIYARRWVDINGRASV